MNALTEMAEKTVAQVVVETLAEIGVRHVFGVPSGGWVDYMEALRRTDGIDFVLTTHEGGAGFMAAVCGRLTGVPGVCFGTFGPGATNLSTGVGCAFLDRSPVVALTDEMAESMRARTTQMGIDHQALFAPITKKTTRLELGRVREILLDAAHLAMSERPGPVHIGLPLGLSPEMEAAPGRIDSEATLQTYSPPPPPAAASNDLLEEMVRHFGAAEKPVLAVGLGAVRAGAQEKILAIAEQFSLPIVLTPMAKGMVPESHPCYAGVLFHALSDQVGATHQQADLVLAVGYDPVEFNFEAWMPKVPLVNIDTVAADIDTSTYDLAVDVVGNIGASLQYLLEHRLMEGRVEKGWDLRALAERRRRMFEQLSAHARHSSDGGLPPEDDGFGPRAALDILRDVLPDDGIMTADVGAHLHLIGQRWPTPRPGAQLMTNGWSSMGYAIPAAIAAKLCHPERPVCAVVGDGGFLMTAGELAVAVRERLPIVFVLLADSELALIRIKQERKGNPMYGTPVGGTLAGDGLPATSPTASPVTPPPPASSVFGVPMTRATNAVELESALRAGFAADGPRIVEAIINPEEYEGLVLRNDRGGNS
jgi:acetolactate synthase-1/2/3 large subunit